MDPRHTIYCKELVNELPLYFDAIKVAEHQQSYWDAVKSEVVEKFLER